MQHFRVKFSVFDHFIDKNACYVNQVRPNIQITSIFPFYLALDKQNQYFVQNLSGFFTTSVDVAVKWFCFIIFQVSLFPNCWNMNKTIRDLPRVIFPMTAFQTLRQQVPLRFTPYIPTLFA